MNTRTFESRLKKAIKDTNSLNRDQWKEEINDLWIEKSEVVSSNGVAFSALKYKDFMEILDSELEKVRQETRKEAFEEIMEEMPKKKVQAIKHRLIEINIDGFNDCHDQVNTLLESKLSTVKK